VSNLCLGTMTFTGRFADHVDEVNDKAWNTQCNQTGADDIIEKFVDMGGNFIDTADCYSNGNAEEIIGEWIRIKELGDTPGKWRRRLIIATKVRFFADHFYQEKAEPGDYYKNANECGLSRWHIRRSVEESLERLQTTYIDLYQVHCSDAATPLEETLSTLNDLVTEGKIRYVGVCNLTGWQLQKCVDLCKMNKWTRIITLQQQWNLLVRETEFELVDVCRNEGIGFLPWSPLKGGWLTGKYTSGMKAEELPEQSRVTWASGAEGRTNQSHPTYEQYAKPKVFDLLAKMEEIGKFYGKGVNHVALRWLIQKDIVPSVIIGVRSVSQLEDNMGAIGWELSQEHMDELDAISAPELPYPYEMIFRANADRKRNNVCK